MSDTKNPQSSGSQDSIDLDTILNRYAIARYGWRSLKGDPEAGYAGNVLKKDLLAWHNTQLKASIPEKLQPVCGDPDCIEAKMYNQAIDDMQVNLEKA